jgi:protein transport protein HofB
LFELLEVDDEIRDAITSGASVVTIRKLAVRTGYEPLHVDGCAKVAAGETSREELRRVLGWTA